MESQTPDINLLLFYSTLNGADAKLKDVVKIGSHWLLGREPMKTVASTVGFTRWKKKKKREASKTKQVSMVNVL